MCGIVGIYDHKEAANVARQCLHALQHRGQESAGIVTSDGKNLYQHKAMGHAANIFSPETLAKLPGNCAIGHVRYSTSGESSLKNAYPLVVEGERGVVAVAHNGNLTNYKDMRSTLEKEGVNFQTTLDSEAVVRLVAGGKDAPVGERLAEVLRQVRGSYSFVFLLRDGLIAARDPKGFRPLVIGKLNGSYIVVSETCALANLNAEYVREVEPGEIVIFDKNGVKNFKPFLPEKRKTQCIFEYVYFARPDSNVFGRDVYPMRVGFGRELAREQPAKADIVVPVPDSGIAAAIGYSETSGIPFQMGLIRSHGVGRTFIEPREESRRSSVKIKLNPVREILKGRRVVCVDDSIVRGTTSAKIVSVLKDAGASEVHMRIASPPVMWPCFYGINTPTREELVACSRTAEELAKEIGADSLAYLSREALYWFKKEHQSECFCDACFTGDYPEERA